MEKQYPYDFKKQIQKLYWYTYSSYNMLDEAVKQRGFVPGIGKYKETEKGY